MNYPQLITLHRFPLTMSNRSVLRPLVQRLVFLIFVRVCFWWDFKWGKYLSENAYGCYVIITGQKRDGFQNLTIFILQNDHLYIIDEHAKKIYSYFISIWGLKRGCNFHLGAAVNFYDPSCFIHIFQLLKIYAYSYIFLGNTHLHVCIHICSHIFCKH